MANKVGQFPIKRHCGAAMGTWRNTRWCDAVKRLVPVRWFMCMQCGHREFERLDKKA